MSANIEKIDKIYIDLCIKLLESGKTVGNTKELTNVRITLNDITKNVISVRNLSHSYLFAEWIWYLTGRNDVEFISKFASKWKDISDDGLTNNSAYGYLMKSAFGFDQIEKVIELLKKDPESRRAVINLNTPNKNVIETKDEPCTICLQFYIRENKLYCTGMMRSNDIWYGFPYDIAFFTLLQRIIADRLEVEYGTYTHFVTSLHVYEKNISNIKKVISDCPDINHFSYDHQKFMKDLDFASKLLDLAIRHCDEYYNRKYILYLAKLLFDYKESNE